MRIKLRLYVRDLDLLALKQHPNFNLGAAIRQALCDFVERGECDRIHVPKDCKYQVVLKNDQIDISFKDDKHKDVIEWILSLRPRMRSSAIKTVIRSAIANPVLFPFEIDSDLAFTVHTAETQKADPKIATPVEPDKKDIKEDKTPKTPADAAEHPKQSSPWDIQHTPDQGSEDDELDLLEIDFENY